MIALMIFFLFQG